MKENFVKRALCILLVLSLILPTGITGILAIDAFLSQPAQVEYVIPEEPEDEPDGEPENPGDAALSVPGLPI